jgi:hypothetical protein
MAAKRGAGMFNALEDGSAGSDIILCVVVSGLGSAERPFLASQFSGSRFLFAPPSSERLLVLTSLYFVCVCPEWRKK